MTVRALDRLNTEYRESPPAGDSGEYRRQALHFPEAVSTSQKKQLTLKRTLVMNWKNKKKTDNVLQRGQSYVI